MSGISIERVDHLGIRVTDVEPAIAFYGALGFEFKYKVEFDAVTIMRNAADVEINLITNGEPTETGGNILMDVPVKYPGYTHVALRVASIKDALTSLAEHGISISQGPVRFGDTEEVSIFVRDPDRNVIELRGTDAGLDDGDIEAYIED